ncbi:hypothetical protein ES703_60427 [subsurface metagenome]
MNPKELKAKWEKDIEKDDIRELQMDEQRLDRCQYKIQYEPYSWCDLSDNVCVEDTGNSDFDVECENNTARELE